VTFEFERAVLGAKRAASGAHRTFVLSGPVDDNPTVTPRVGIGLFIAVTAVSWAAILIRLADAPPLAIAAWRLTLIGIPFGLRAALTHRAQLARLDSRGWTRALCAGVALALHFATWILSLKHTSIASSTALVTTTPIWVSLIDRPPKRTLIGMAIAVAGSIVIAGTDFGLDPHALLGDALALAGAVFGATYLSLGKRTRSQLDLAAYVGVVFPVAALCLMIAAAATGPLTGFTPRTWLCLALLALVPQGIGHTLLNWALEHVSTALVAIAILGEPILSTLLAIPILGEVPGPARVTGGAIVLAGVALAAWSESAAAATRPMPSR
jgi:drug/metabolite transporter (DMT)-like permease